MITDFFVTFPAAKALHCTGGFSRRSPKGMIPALFAISPAAKAAGTATAPTPFERAGAVV